MKHTVIALKIAVTTWFLFWGFMFYELFFPFIPFQYNIIPLPTRTPIITSGQDVIIVGDYCKYVKSPANVVVSFERLLTESEKKQGIKSVVITLKTDKNTNLPFGCHVIDFAIPTPNTLRSGQYKIIISVTGKINPFRISHEEYHSVPITVYENKKEIIFNKD